MCILKYMYLADRGVKKNREFTNDRHTILNFAHYNNTILYYLTGYIVLIFSICVYFNFAVPILLASLG